MTESLDTNFRNLWYGFVKFGGTSNYVTREELANPGSWGPPSLKEGRGGLGGNRAMPVSLREWGEGSLRQCIYQFHREIDCVVFLVSVHL